MKTNDLRILTDEKLEKRLKDLELEQFRASANWNTGDSKMKEFVRKTHAPVGSKTSLKKDIRREIAKVKTIMDQRKMSEELCKNKPKSKRRMRRLRGREN